VPQFFRQACKLIWLLYLIQLSPGKQFRRQITFTIYSRRPKPKAPERNRNRLLPAKQVVFIGVYYSVCPRKKTNYLSEKDVNGVGICDMVDHDHGSDKILITFDSDLENCFMISTDTACERQRLASSKLCECKCISVRSELLMGRYSTHTANAQRA